MSLAENSITMTIFQLNGLKEAIVLILSMDNPNTGPIFLSTFGPFLNPVQLLRVSQFLFLPPVNSSPSHFPAKFSCKFPLLPVDSDLYSLTHKTKSL